MSEVMQGILVADKSRSVLGRADINQLLDFEAEKQLMGCEDDSCLAELAAAMNAQRIVSGTMDKVGSKYFVVLNELDAINVKSLSRVQKQLPFDEDLLIQGITSMTQELMRDSAKATGQIALAAEAGSSIGEPPFPQESALSGRVLVSSEPEGALEVFVGEQGYGKTPVTLKGQLPGHVALRLLPEGGKVFEIDVSVVAGQETTVRVKPNQVQTVTQAQIQEYEETRSSYLWIGGASVIFGLGGCIGSYPVGLVSFWIGTLIANGFGAGTLGASVGALCGACGCTGSLLVSVLILGYGVYKIFFADLDSPILSAGPVHQIEITTPGEDGETINRMIPVASLRRPVLPPVDTIAQTAMAY
jgi:hypothetical protein